MTKDVAIIDDFKNALLRFEEALRLSPTDINRDASIQRFEFCFDLAWKCAKEILEKEHGTVCVSPKTCLREAYKNGLIEYDTDWIKMTDDRNLTAHTYNEEVAERIYATLPKTLELFTAFLKKIEK